MPNVNNQWEMSEVTIETPFSFFPKQAADGTAATATAETPMGLVGPGPVSMTLGACQIHPAAALTADPSNNATITVSKRTAAAPGTPVVIAQATTSPAGTGTWTAWQAVNIALAAGAFVSPGDAITFQITKNGTGVIVPAGVCVLYLKGT